MFFRPFSFITCKGVSSACRYRSCTSNSCSRFTSGFSQSLVAAIIQFAIVARLKSRPKLFHSFS
ncbi:hypothetical protein D3C77_572600 [compost metagenome]